MSTTISSGSTLEYALTDISKSDYAVFSDEAEYLLRDLKAGDTFEHTFTMFAFRYNSRLLQRAAKIIIAAKQAGAGLVDTLEAIAEDIRQLKMIFRERKASTMMQVTFLIMAGVFIAPAISAFALSLVSHLSESGLQQADHISGVLTEVNNAVQFYILFECASIALAISIMREGKASSSVLFMPFFLIGGYVIFVVGKEIGITLIGGL
jgi:flagellar protein FlaJ